MIGAGTAGGAIAARLALAGFFVGLIEPGSFYQLDNGNRTTVPGYDQTTHPNNAVDSLIEYDLITEPEPVRLCAKFPLQYSADPLQGLNGRRLHYSQGRTFGGR